MIVAVPVMFTLLTGCTWDSQNPNLSSMWPFKHGSILNISSNGEIIHELMTIDKTEIALTKLAKTHSSCHKIKKLAASLEADHMKNLRAIRHLSHKTQIKPMMNSMSTHIEHEGQREMNELKSLHNKDFDRAFIKDIINQHQNALQIIDSGIMQSTNEMLTAYLKTLREHLVMHSQRAEVLQKESTLY
jgi:putative membrane protein